MIIFRHNPSHQAKRSNDTQKFVFIRVKERHEYDLNPKLIKFFLSEVLKEEKYKAKLYNMSQKIDRLSKDKIIKFGLQQYFNVMDEIVSLMEENISGYQPDKNPRFPKSHQNDTFDNTSNFKNGINQSNTQEGLRDYHLPDTKKNIIQDRSHKSLVRFWTVISFNSVDS